jgi:hypothetical protein
MLCSQWQGEVLASMQTVVVRIEMLGIFDPVLFESSVAFE